MLSIKNVVCIILMQRLEFLTSISKKYKEKIEASINKLGKKKLMGYGLVKQPHSLVYTLFPSL
jgi:hypothetical protein